jgi:hypothetical protein
MVESANLPARQERKLNMGQILDTAEEWLKKDDWKYDREDDKNLIRCGVKAENASYRIVLQEKPELDILLLYVFNQNNIVEDKRMTIAEFLTRANYGLNTGNFEFDMSDGELRYKVSVDVEGAQLTSVMVKNMISAGVSTMDRYYPGIMAISFAEASAEEAIKKIEN